MRCCSVMLAAGVHHREARTPRPAARTPRAPALEQAEALDRVGAPAQVHAGLVVLELGAPRQDAVERDLERHAEVERQVGAHREAVERAHPVGIHAAHHVARERGVDVAVGEHDHARLERRHDLALDAVREVGGVEQREGERREERPSSCRASSCALTIGDEFHSLKNTR